MIYNFLILDFYQEVNQYVNVNLYRVNPDGSTSKSHDLEQIKRMIE